MVSKAEKSMLDAIESFSGRLAALERRAVPTPAIGGQCTAALPHADLGFQRGPNLYRCPCGMIYRKDGKGGLENAS